MSSLCAISQIASYFATGSGDSFVSDWSALVLMLLVGCLWVKEILHVKTNLVFVGKWIATLPSSVLDGKFRSNCASAQQLESKIFSWSLHDHSFENRRWDSLFGFTLEILMCQARGILEIQTCVKCFMIWFKFYRPFSRVSSHFPCEVLYCSRWHSKFWLLQTTN